MTQQYGPILQSVDYPRMDRGMDTTLPNRAMTPGSDGPLFKSVVNMVGHDGVLASWFGVFPLAEFETNGYPTISKNGSYFETTPDGLINGQCPVYMFYDFPQTWNMSGSSSQTTFGSFLGVVVTSREIHIYSPQNSTWYNATPVYSGDPAVGTVDVTAGGLVTINTGLHPWSTRKIVPGQLIQFAGDANWYTITSVLTGPNRLQTDFAGVAKVNVAYTIRRCFGGRNYSHGNNLLYGTVFNGDLYIAGRTLAGEGVGPAVIRVSDIYSNVYTTEYLLAPYDLTSLMTANGSVVANLWDIKGLQILPDGRVVVATAEVPSTKQGIVGNRLRYSSNTASGSISAQEIWSASPAGFIDVVDHAGEISALGKLGPSTLTIHFHRGISLGTYTAQYDPPLAIQASGAKVGCIAPRTLQLYAGTEIFLGADGIVHAFNGESTTPICNETVDLTHWDENEQASFTIANCHACVDTKKEHYRLFFCDNNFEDVKTPPAAYADYEIRTVCWIIDLEDGGLYKATFSPHITCCTFPAIGPDAATRTVYTVSSQGGDFGLMVAGIGTAAPSGVANEDVDGHFIYGISAAQGPVGNQVWYNGAYTTTTQDFSFETDWLDFGLPGVDKTLSHALIWFQKSDLAIAALPTVIAYYGSSGASVTATMGASTFAQQDDIPYLFSFAPYAAEVWKIGVSRAGSNNASVARGLAVRRMKLYYQTHGEIEASNPDL